MKKIIFLTISVCIVLFLGSCSVVDTSTQEVLDKKAIVMGYDKNYMPMGFVNEDGIYTGFDIDLAKEISKRIITASGVSATLNIVPAAADEAIGGLADGSLDFLGNSLSIFDQKQNSISYSTPVFNNSQVIIVNADSAITVKDDLENKKIAVITGTLSEKAIKDDELLSSKATTIEISDRRTALDNLNSKTADAIVIDELTAKYFISQGASIRVLDEKLREDEYCLVFDSESKGLMNKVNDIIGELKKDGTLETLSQKWFGENIIK